MVIDFYIRGLAKITIKILARKCKAYMKFNGNCLCEEVLSL
jgi:hypothetical protein